MHARTEIANKNHSNIKIITIMNTDYRYQLETPKLTGRRQQKTTCTPAATTTPPPSTSPTAAATTSGAVRCARSPACNTSSPAFWNNIPPTPTSPTSSCTLRRRPLPASQVGANYGLGRSQPGVRSELTAGQSWADSRPECGIFFRKYFVDSE